MKHLIHRTMTRAGALAAAALMLFSLAACGSQDAPQDTGNSTGTPTESSDATTGATVDVDMGETLVVFFSNTGNTQAVAEKVATATGADLVEIEPAVPYTDEDLDYNNDSSRAMVELDDPNARPEIANTVEGWDAYDTVFVGYPIWWGRTPPIMQTFAESYDWTGKTVIPFCTSGSSDIGSSADVLEDAAAGSTWLEGQRFSGSASSDEIESWLNELFLS